MSGVLLERNVQAIVPPEVHRLLRDEAYEKDVPLKDLIRDILIKHATEFGKKVLLQKAL